MGGADLLGPWLHQFERLISHADDDQAFRIPLLPFGVEVRDLANARASPGTEDLDHHGPAFHILDAQRWRVEPSSAGEVRHRAALRCRVSSGCKRERGARDKKRNRFHDVSRIS